MQIITLSTLPAAQFNSSFVINGDSVSAQIYNLDAASQKTQEINLLLENHKYDDAKQIQSITKDAIATNEEAFKMSAKGVFIGEKYQIEKLPAIIINDRYVLYGSTDPSVAYERLNAYLSAQVAG
jgi:integrating conjugative element protein (TIGR03757 family)